MRAGVFQRPTHLLVVNGSIPRESGGVSVCLAQILSKVFPVRAGVFLSCVDDTLS